jgi:2-polyprenyl-6-methoxyphenol hydroxylase-like FAD-dependent oxidoreductase
MEGRMNNESAEITHAMFRMWLRPDGIVHLVWGPGVAMGLKDAIAAIDAMTELTGGRRSPLLVDVHDAGAQDRPARVEFVRRGDLVSAVALIVGTPLSRMMGNFFLTVSQPMAPTRLFDDEASALAWLQEFAA